MALLHPARFRVALLFCTLLSCAKSAPFVWVDQVHPEIMQVRDTYVIEDGDVLHVRVYNDDKLSTHARVRSDGKISLALVGDVMARGKTPQELARDVEARLSKFMNAPAVTVGVEEVRPIRVTVIGHLRAPGVYTLPQNSTVLEAIASAGGVTEFADRTSLYVVRRTPPLRIRFTYDALGEAGSRASTFTLKNGDVLAVE